MAAKPVPDRCNTVNVYLIVRDVDAATDFYVKAFGGEKLTRMAGPDGSVMHAEVGIGNSTIMLSSENPQWDAKSPETLGGSPASMHLYVEDADAVFKQATDAGCQALFPVAEMFWGDRYGKVVDPFGFQWGIATHVEDVSEEEMARRAEAYFKQMAAECAAEGKESPA